MAERTHILSATHTTHGYGSAGTSPKTSTFTMRHEIRSTDTLQSLAVHYNVSVAEIERANKIFPGESIHVRKHLVIPMTSRPSRREQEEDDAFAQQKHQQQQQQQQQDVKSPKAPSSAKDFLSQFDAKFSQTKTSLDKVLSKPIPVSTPLKAESERPARTATLKSVSPVTNKRGLPLRSAWQEPELEVDSNNTFSHDDMFEL